MSTTKTETTAKKIVAPKAVAPKETAPKAVAPKETAPKVAAPKVTKAATPPKEGVVKAPKAAKPQPKDVPAVTVKEEPVKPEEVKEKTKSDEFVEKLTSLVSTINALKAEYKAQEKKWARELKTAEKVNSKRKRKTERSPSGFVKPTLISSKMAVFLEKPEGTEIARTEVTSLINTYIKANKLQNPENGRLIVADAKLKELLNWKDTDEPLSYFNLQKYLSPHFPKSAKAQAADAQTA